MFDKQKLWDNIDKVAAYNAVRDDEQKIYVEMHHLPDKLRRDKKSLLEDFKKAKLDDKFPKWKFVKSTGEYCYYIGKVCYEPTNNFTALQFDD